MISKQLIDKAIWCQNNNHNSNNEIMTSWRPSQPYRDAADLVTAAKEIALRPA